MKLKNLTVNFILYLVFYLLRLAKFILKSQYKNTSRRTND